MVVFRFFFVRWGFLVVVIENKISEGYRRVLFLGGIVGFWVDYKNNG